MLNSVVGAKQCQSEVTVFPGPLYALSIAVEVGCILNINLAKFDKIGYCI